MESSELETYVSALLHDNESKKLQEKETAQCLKFWIMFSFWINFVL